MTRKGSSQADRLRLRDIRDGVIVLEGGCFRAVVEVGSVNFQLLDDLDQQGLILSFATALNSWQFAVQIVIRVLPVDLDRYLANLQRRSEGLSGSLAELARDHRLHIRRLARNQALLDHRCYLVIPADDPPRRWRWPWQRTPDQAQLLTESVRQQLSLRCSEVQRGLGRCGLAVRRLDTQELGELYYAYLCPELSQVQKFKADLADYCSLVVTTPAAERQAA